MTRIAVLSNSMSAGGAERVANLLVKNLVEKGLEVSLVAVNDSPIDLIDINSRVYSLHRNPKAHVIRNFQIISNFRKSLKTIKPDILIVNCEYPELLSCFANRNIRTIVVEHTTSPWRFLPKFGWLIRAILKLKSVEWVSVAPDITIWPFNQIPKYIPNYFFTSSKNILVSQQTKIRRLVFIGRLTPEKNPEFFLKVCKESSLPGLVIGSGALEAQLKKLSDRLKINVEYTGFTPTPWDFCRDGDVLIVPSKWEGDGLVVLEALSLGFPILLADIPDLRRFKLPNLNFFSMAHSDPENCTDLADRLTKQLNSYQNLIPNLEYRNMVLKERESESITRKWLHLLLN
jgi:glycosyltransferase involved in cell wall biosynthesis